MLVLLFITGILLIIVGTIMDKAERARRDRDPDWWRK